MRYCLAICVAILLGCTSVERSATGDPIPAHSKPATTENRTSEITLSARSLEENPLTAEEYEQIHRVAEIELRVVNDEIRSQRRSLGSLPPELSARIKKQRESVYADPAYVLAEKRWRAIKIRKDLEAATWERNLLSNFSIGDLGNGGK